MFLRKYMNKSSLCQCIRLFKLSVSNYTTEPAATANALRSRKSKSTNLNVQFYVDTCYVRVSGGNGGDGCMNFASEFAKEMAGPDGGDGGNGGHILFVCTTNVKNLNHVPSIIEAKHGEKGSKRNRFGKNANHTVVDVPIGTIVKNSEGKILGDLSKEGTIFVAARGGSGGRGNKFFTTDTEQCPDIAEYGAQGEKNKYILEIRSMAHVGLLGFPNAGKSTLLRAISRARPKVASYPFTTLHPHIGMILYDDYEQIAVADLPGLIPGSHKNKGLGIQFLQHAERCCCLLYMLDASTVNPWEQLETLQYELSQFSEELLNRPKLVIANKIDLPEAKENLPILQKHFKDVEIIPVSAKMGINLSKLLKTIRQIYDTTLPKNVANS